MWARAVVWFGLDLGAAWLLPLRAFFELAAVRRDDERVLDYRAAIIAGSMSGAQPGDLFPSLRPRRMTVEQTQDAMRDLVRLLGGEVREA